MASKNNISKPSLIKEQVKNYTLLFLKEIIPVVAGILIALFIENWNSERKDKAYIKQVFLTVNSELKDSKEDIKETIPKQKLLIDSLEFYYDSKSVSILNIVTKCKGIYAPQIKISAWKAVSNSKIDLIDYKKITLLSNLEEQKQYLNNKTEFLLNYLYSNINESDKNVKMTFKMILLDIMQTEKTMQRIIELYEKQ